MGHLFFGDNRRVEAWRRGVKAALAALPAVAGAALLLGTAWAWAAPAVALALLAGSALAGLALRRALESRADAFAAEVAGPAAAEAFLRRLAAEAPGAGGGAFSGHPSTGERLSRVERVQRLSASHGGRFPD